MQRHPQEARIGHIELPAVQYQEITFCRRFSQYFPSHHGPVELKRAVLDQLAVNTSVRAHIDVLKKDSPHRGLNIAFRFIYFHRKYMLALCSHK